MERGSCLTLTALVKALEKFDPDQVVSAGFGSADSYRGYYEDLAFAPGRETTVRQMMMVARAAEGQTFEAYKGGSYRATGETLCWLADWGKLGEPLTLERLLSMVLGPIVPPEKSEG
jgi:hypothetical protein